MSAVSAPQQIPATTGLGLPPRAVGAEASAAAAEVAPQLVGAHEVLGRRGLKQGSQVITMMPSQKLGAAKPTMAAERPM